MKITENIYNKTKQTEHFDTKNQMFCDNVYEYITFGLWLVLKLRGSPAGRVSAFSW